MEDKEREFYTFTFRVNAQHSMSEENPDALHAHTFTVTVYAANPTGKDMALSGYRNAADDFLSNFRGKNLNTVPFFTDHGIIPTVENFCRVLSEGLTMAAENCGLKVISVETGDSPFSVYSEGPALPNGLTAEVPNADAYRTLSARVFGENPELGVYPEPERIPVPAAVPEPDIQIPAAAAAETVPEKRNLFVFPAAYTAASAKLAVAAERHTAQASGIQIPAAEQYAQEEKSPEQLRAEYAAKRRKQTVQAEPEQAQMRQKHTGTFGPDDIVLVCSGGIFSAPLPEDAWNDKIA